MRKKKRPVSRRSVRRRLFLEALEGRRLLVATDLASISGLVFDDFSGNGYDSGEEVSGATLVLYRDNGNGTFDQSSDTQVTSTTTGADGRYTFSRLTAANYFVLQDAQTVDGSSLQRQVSPLISIDTTAVEGRIVQVIDDFDTTQQTVNDSTNDGIPVTSSIAAPEAIGGERDLYVNKTSVNGAVQLSVDDPLLPNVLSFDSIATGQGERRITWDGPDGDAMVVTDTGLGDVDLTSAGDALGVQLQIGADLPGGNAVVRIYSDDGSGESATRFSTASIPIPQTGGMVPFLAEFIPYSQFTATSGGGADFNNVGAIEMEITGAANVNGSAELVGTVGTTVFTQDFANFASADLRLSKTIDNATPNIGQNVTFTITLNNDGPDTATNVQVRDQLPAGVTFVSGNSSTGSYSSSTGIWTVGTIANGSVATLLLVGQIQSAGTRTNTAEITASDLFDPDSTPGNNNPSEDDQAQVSFVTESIDLSLTKTAQPTSIVVGNEVTFTLTLSNAGPSTATNVVVQDVLPNGISFVRATPSQGTYSSQTSLWSVGSVATGASTTLALVGRIDATGPKTNTAQVMEADQVDIDSTPGNNDPTEDDQDSVTIESPEIDLSLTKTVDNAFPDVGENLTFTISVANAGPSNATGVRVRDLLPTGLQFVSASTVAGSYNSQTGIWDLGSIVANGSAVLSITATPTTTNTVTNTAEVIAAVEPDSDSTPGNGDPNEDDQDSVMVGAQQIDLSLVKTVDNDRPNVNDTIEFQIVVSNAGPSAATGVEVQDLLPTGLAYVSTNVSAGTYSSSTGRWTIGTINRDASATLTIRALVNDAMAVTNVAEVVAATPIDRDSTPGNGDPNEDDQDSVVITPQIANLTLSKTVDNQAANVGENVTFSLTLNNLGGDTATNVLVRDQLPSGITFVSATANSGTYDSATGIWTVGTVAVGAPATLQIVGTIASSGAKTNTAQVTASDQFDPNSTPGNGIEEEDDQDSITVTPPVIDLSLDKTIDVPRPIVGQTIRYTVTVANDGPSNATGVVVSDELPNGVTFISSATASGGYDPGTGRWNIGTIPAGGTATLTIDATVAATTTTTNAAEVFAANEFDPDSTPGNGSTTEDDYGSVSFTPQRADLSLTKSVDKKRPNVGEDVTFTIVVSNAGPDGATSVTVLDQLPDGLEFVSASPEIGSYNPGNGIWNLGELALGTSATLSLVATSRTAEVVTNTAQVQTADQIDPDSTPGNGVENEDDQQSVDVEGQQIDLELSKQVDNERPNVGDEIRFTIRVDNRGPSNATSVSVRDVIPDGLEYQSSDASRGGYNVSDGTWNIGSIAADEFVTLDLYAVVDRILSVENVAEVLTADQPDVDSTPNNGIPSEDDQDSAPVITQVADLSLTKTASQDRPNVGEQVTFTIDLLNDGPDPATNVSVLDQLPDGVSFVSATANNGSYDSRTGIWSINFLDDGDSAMLQIVASVDSIGKATNVAEVVAADQADPNSTPNNNVPTEDDQDSATIDPPVIDLALGKAANPLRPSVGGELTYTLLIRNDGPDRATNIVVNDTLPEDVTFVSANPSVGLFNPSTGNWTLSSLAAGGSATLVLRTTVDRPGEPENRAQVMAADQFDSDSTPGNDDGIDGNGNDEDDQASVTVVTASSDLSLTKSIDDDRPGVGSNVTFTVRVANSGPDDAEDVVVRDIISPGMTFISSNPSVGSYNETTGLWTIPKMVVGKIASIEIVARVDIYGDRINTAEIMESSQYDPDSTPGNNDPEEDDQASVPFYPQLVDLALAKLVDNPTPKINETIRFTIVLDNAGPSDATEVVVSDQLPTGLTVAGINASQGVYDPTLGIWDVGDVPMGANPRLEIDVKVDSPDPKINVAEVFRVHQPDSDSTPDNNDPNEDDYGQVTVTPQVSDLELNKSVNNTTPNKDEELDFTLIVLNRGPSTATGVAVRDILPDGVEFLRSSATSGSYNPSSGVWAIPSVAIGSIQSLQIVGRMTSRDAVTNVAEIIASDQFDPDSIPDNQVPTEDDISDVTVTPKLVDLSVSSSVDIKEPYPGQNFKMTFRVTNDGPDRATGVAAAVTIPAGITVISSRPVRGTLIDGVWNVGNLNAGETVELTITARADVRGTKNVQIEIIAQDQFDRDSEPNNHVLSEDDQEELLILVPLYSKRLFLA